MPLGRDFFFFFFFNLLCMLQASQGLRGNLPDNAGEAGSISGSGRSPGGGNGNPLSYSCLENLLDRGAWQATVHKVTKESDMTWMTEHAVCFTIYVVQIVFSPVFPSDQLETVCFLQRIYFQFKYLRKDICLALLITFMTFEQLLRLASHRSWLGSKEFESWWLTLEVVPGITLREQGIEIRKGRKLIKGSLLNRWLLWISGFQSQGETLRDSVEYSSELSQLRGEEAEYLFSSSRMSLAKF